MNESLFTLKIKPESYILAGSGEGFGAAIDDDITYDDYGLPYIPGKRIKGLIYESCLEVCEMPLGFDYSTVEKLFKDTGGRGRGRIEVDTLRVEGYDDAKIKLWLEWAFNNDDLKNLVTANSVLSSLTDIRHHIAMEKDVKIAKDHSLRTVRVLKPEINGTPIIFKGALRILDNDDNEKKLLSCACLNLRRIGKKRSRGFGKVKCTLLNGNEDITNKTAEGFNS